jgi:hypothetical protein
MRREARRTPPLIHLARKRYDDGKEEWRKEGEKEATYVSSKSHVVKNRATETVNGRV